MANGGAQLDKYQRVKKVAVFRKFAEDATKNSHTTIKQVWAILFTGGTFALLHSFDDWVSSVENMFAAPADPITAQSWLHLHGMQLSTALVSLLLFVIYLLTFYRFYVGNIRVFDMRYDEIFKFIDSIHEEKNRDGADELAEKDEDYRALLRYSDSLSKSETFHLMVNTLIIVYLTVLPLNPSKFLLVYAFLLLFDLIWMWRRAEDQQHFFSKQFFDVFKNLPASIEQVFPKYATGKWHANNRFSLIILAFIIALYWLQKIANAPESDLLEQILLWVGTVVALLNCFVDLRETWSFYNPRFSEAHDALLPPPVVRAEVAADAGR